VPGATVERLFLDDATLAGESSERPMPTSGAHDLSYVIYTSGSTGRPKGVLVEHRGAVHFLEAVRRELEVSPRDCWLAVSSLSFDVSVMDLFLPLSMGARVALVPREAAVDGARLIEELGRSGATFLQATPTTWRLLIEAGWVGTPGLKMLCGAEVLTGDLAEQLLRRGEALWNLYGPTETTVWASTYRVRQPQRLVPIGRPIGNARFYVLDPAMQPQPPGLPGELYIGGPGVTRGYLNRPELTADHFVAHPFAAAPERVYRTGDLCRLLSDGALEFLGRRDWQLKVRGHRIEAGEVEAALLRHPAVRRAVVVAREDAPGDQRLVGYVVFGDTEVDNAELRAFLRQTLPDYMVPSAIVALPELPQTPSGKLNRAVLPSPAPDGNSPVSAAPRSETEQRLAAIWVQLLRASRVGVHDNFFELGGHSLLAAQLVSRVRAAFGVELPVRTVFDLPTLAQLADGIDTLRFAVDGRFTGQIPGRSQLGEGGEEGEL
jgi:amino acid adenylation domain-containing protein